MLTLKEKAGATRICPLDSSKLRQLWSVIDETQTSILLGFTDTELIQQLLRQLENKGLLSVEELTTVSAYLHSRLMLIRDLAKARLAI